MSGSARGRQLYQMMANGEAVSNEVVNDLLAEAMVKKAESKVSGNIYYFLILRYYQFDYDHSGLISKKRA